MARRSRGRRGQVRNETLEDLKGEGRVHYDGKSVEANYRLKVQLVRTLTGGDGGPIETRQRMEGRGTLDLDDEGAAFDIAVKARVVELELEDGRRATIAPYYRQAGGKVRFMLSSAIRDPE